MFPGCLLSPLSLSISQNLFPTISLQLLVKSTTAYFASQGNIIMDPITAIGAASAILSFIDFSWKLVAGARDIYKSADGTSADNANIREMASNLQGLTENLGTGALGSSKPENDLRQLAADCNALSNELKTILHKLQSPGGVRNAVKAKLRSIRRKDDISSMRGRLAEYTSQIILIMNTILL